MDTIEEIVDKRNELFEEMMNKYSFMLMYNGDLMSEDDEEAMAEKIHELDGLIFDLRNESELKAAEDLKQKIKILIDEIEIYFS